MEENASHTFCRSWPLINVPKINHVQESHSITYCVNGYCSPQVLFIDEWGRGVQFKRRMTTVLITSGQQSSGVIGVCNCFTFE